MPRKIVGIPLSNPLKSKSGKRGKEPKKPASKPKPVTQKTLDSSQAKAQTGIQAHAYITDRIDQKTHKRIILAEMDISLDKDWFYCKPVDKSYFIDSEAVLLFGPKKGVVIYDIDMFEPLTEQEAGTDELEPHFSKRADNILRLGFVRQTVGQGVASVGTGGMMDLALKVGVGLAIGIFVGLYLGGSGAVHIPTSTGP